MRNNVSNEKKSSYFPLNSMVNKDPYFMVYYNPYIAGKYNPLYNPTNLWVFFIAHVKSLQTPGINPLKKAASNPEIHL